MKKIMIFVFLITGISLFAQSESFNNFFNHSNLSFLRSDKLSMHHSMNFSSSVGANKKAFYQSVYTNHLNYKLSSKVNLKLNVNFVNNGTASFQNGFSNMTTNNSKNVKVIPEFILDYSPSDNFHMTFEYRNFHKDQFYHNYTR